MKIKFLPGGRLNNLGPFEIGEEIHLPDADGLQLIENGLALPIGKISARPFTITITIKVASQEANHV